MQQLIKIESKTNKGMLELKKEPNFYKVYLIFSEVYHRRFANFKYEL